MNLEMFTFAHAPLPYNVTLMLVSNNDEKTIADSTFSYSPDEIAVVQLPDA